MADNNNENPESIDEEMLKFFETFKGNIKMIIASAFTIIIFTLSLTETTIFSLIGVVLLLISIVFVFELFRYLTGYPKRVENKSPTEKKRIITEVLIQFLNDGGVICLFTAILFIIIHFNLIPISVCYSVYLVFRMIRFITWRCVFLSRDYKTTRFKKFKLGWNILYLIFSIGSTLGVIYGIIFVFFLL